MEPSESVIFRLTDVTIFNTSHTKDKVTIVTITKDVKLVFTFDSFPEGAVCSSGVPGNQWVI